MRKYLLSGLCAIVLTFSPTHLTKAGEHFSPIPFSIILPDKLFFKNLIISALDFEEYLLHDNKHQNITQSFNSFLKF